MPKDHYIPQFYLRNFEIPDRGNQRHWIYSYRRGTTPKAQAIRSVASAVDFDTVSEAEPLESSDLYNKLIRISEDVAPPIIANILASEEYRPSVEDRAALAWFVALLAVRTPTALNYFERDILRFKQQILLRTIRKDCMTNKQKISEIIRNEYPDTSDSDIDEIVEMFLDKDFMWELPQNDHNKVYLRGTGNAYLNNLVNDLMSKNWHVLTAAVGSYFVTGDNPVAFIFTLPLRLRHGKSVFDSAVFVPLLPIVALYIHSYRFSKSRFAIESEQVKYLVRQTMERAETSVFSHESSTELQLRFNSVAFESANLNFKYNFAPYELMRAIAINSFRHFAETRNEET